MHKKAILFILASIMVLSTINFSPITRVFVNEPLSAQEPEIYVAINNPTTKDYDNTNVRVYMDDLGVMLHSNPFDFKHKSTVLKRMQGTLPSDVEPGLHYIRVSVSGKVRDVRYMPIVVG